MAVIGEKELRAQLKSDTLSHAYFIYGDEGYLKEHYIGQIKKRRWTRPLRILIYIFMKRTARSCPMCSTTQILSL